MADGNEAAPGDEPPAEEPSKKYDQVFFLALAAKGKDVWNAWRRDPANKDVPVIFRGVDFSEAPRDQIDFSGFEFGDYADFCKCKWRGGKSRGDFTIFTPGKAYFRAATFGEFVLFTGATFGPFADFTGATFGTTASFTCAAFEAFSALDEVTFSGGATFLGAAFLGHTWFRRAHFKGHADFKGISKEEWTLHLEDWLFVSSEEGRTAVKQQHTKLWELYRSGPDRFQTILFANARFDGEANFSGRMCEDTADFTGARFFRPPNFDSVTNISRIDFTGTSICFAAAGNFFHWTRNSQIPLRLRALRKIAEETKNHDLERDLYIEERKAERGVYLRQLSDELKKAPWRERPLIAARLLGHLLWIIVMFFYWVLADYGRSFARPALWLIASGFFFYWRYLSVLAPMISKVGPLDMDKYKHAVRMLAPGNSVPFVGPLTIDADIKKFLFCRGFGNCTPILPEGYQWLVIGQNLFSITCVFFIGLVLRNYFKIK